MSVARTARRRRKQMTNGYRHLAKICKTGGRPIYRRRALKSVAEAIAAERRRAQAEAARKAKKSA